VFEEQAFILTITARNSAATSCSQPVCGTAIALCGHFALSVQRM